MADYSKPILRKSVQQARERLQERALKILQDFEETIEEARAAGPRDARAFDAALKAQQWLIGHIADDEGNRIVSPSVDKDSKTEDKIKISPVQIGIQLGGINPTLQAPISPVSITEAKVEPINSLPAASSEKEDKS